MMPQPPLLRPMRVSHGQIDLNDETFSLRHRLSDAPDAQRDAAVSRLGLLHPPILREGATSRGFQIVAGRCRLDAAARLLDETASNCLVLPPETDDLTCLAIACEDAAAAGGLTPVERAVLLRKVADTAGAATAVSMFLPLAGFPAQAWRLEQTLLLLDLEEPLLDALHDGRLDENAARELGRLSFSDRLALFELIDTLCLSVSHQRRLIGICRDLSRRTRQTILVILGSPAVQDIVNHPQANTPQKAANLMRWFAEQTSPRYHEAVADHERFCRELHLPPHAVISHAPFFEKDSLTLSLTFSGREELMAFWPRLRPVLLGETAPPADGEVSADEPPLS